MARHFSGSTAPDVLLMLALAAFSIVAVCALVGLAFAVRRRRGGERQSSERHDLDMTPDDRRFLSRFLVSRTAAMTIVYSITLAVVFGLVWILGR